MGLGVSSPFDSVESPIPAAESRRQRADDASPRDRHATWQLPAASDLYCSSLRCPRRAESGGREDRSGSKPWRNVTQSVLLQIQRLAAEATLDRSVRPRELCCDLRSQALTKCDAGLRVPEGAIRLRFGSGCLNQTRLPIQSRRER